MINVKKVLAYIYLLYAVTTIFTPKIRISEFAGIYLFEVICTILSFYLLISNRLRFSSIEKNYFLYVVFSLFSRFLWMNTVSLNMESLLILIKYFSFILLIPVAFYLKSYLTETALIKILYSQVLFVVLAGGYTIYHTFFFPIDVSILVNEYSPEYRLLGFVGYALTSDGLNYIGTGSVQMGVYVAILFLIFLSLYFRIRKPTYLIMSFILFIGLLLTYSRSGFVVMSIGIIYLLSFKFLNKRVFKIILILVVSVLLLIFFTDFWTFVSSWGSFAKLEQGGFVDTKRQDYWRLGLSYVLNNPLKLIFGIGYGSIESIFGFGTLESLFFDTLIESGVFGLIFLLLFVYYIWKFSKKYSKPFQSNDYCKAVLYGYYLAIPGLFIANTVGGNSLQTDFMAPTFYLSLGICLAHTKKNYVNRESAESQFQQ